MEQGLARALEIRHEPALVRILPRRVLQSLHTQDNVLQRTFVIAHLSVLHLRVNYDHVIRRDGQQLAAYVELPTAADNVEYLGAIMCV